jgi:hypothetical protein
MLEEIDIADNGFELYDNIEGNGNMMFIPIMDEYPDAENTFDVSFGVDGQESGGGVDPNAVIGAVGQVAGAISSFKKTGVKADIKAVCGRRPILKKKRASSGWDACASAYQQSMLGMGGGGGSNRSQENVPVYQPPTETGMSTGAKVGIAITVVAVLGIGGFLIWKNTKKG